MKSRVCVPSTGAESIDKRGIPDYGINGKASSIDFRSSSGGGKGANENKMAPMRILQS